MYQVPVPGLLLDDAFNAANVLSEGSGHQQKAVFLFSFETDLAGG